MRWLPLSEMQEQSPSSPPGSSTLTPLPVRESSLRPSPFPSDLGTLTPWDYLFASSLAPERSPPSSPPNGSPNAITAVSSDTSPRGAHRTTPPAPYVPSTTRNQSTDALTRSAQRRAISALYSPAVGSLQPNARIVTNPTQPVTATAPPAESRPLRPHPRSQRLLLRRTWILRRTQPPALNHLSQPGSSSPTMNLLPLARALPAFSPLRRSRRLLGLPAPPQGTP